MLCLKLQHILYLKVILLLLLLEEDGCLVYAAKSCVFNGAPFTRDEVVLDISSACAYVECAPRLKKNGKESKKHVEMKLQEKSLSDCTCNIAAKNAIISSYEGERESKISPNTIELKGPSTWIEKIPATKKSQPRKQKPKSLYGRKKDKFQKQKKIKAEKRKELMLKAKKKKKKCKFNKKKFKNGKTIISLSNRCVNLVCQEGTIVEQFMSGCTCSDSDDTPDPDPGRDCQDYVLFTADHSMCQPKSSVCESQRLGVTKDEKATILRVHNEFRAKVALGNEERGNPGPQPSASNMRELTWNDELALVAQAWTETCPAGHDCNACRKILGRDYAVGQNIYWQFSSSDSGEVWTAGITAFYDEVEFVPNTLVDEFQSIATAFPIGHYTQLVWALTYEIGCGAMYYGPCERNGFTFQHCKVYVCNYGPAGNFIGQPMYLRGNPASQCDNGESSNFDGLCK